MSFQPISFQQTRRDWLAQSSMAAVFAASAYGQSDETQFVEVETSRGRLRGEKKAGLTTFRGVPYAGSVSGANRFKAAPALQRWAGVRDALKFGPPSPQPGRTARLR